MNPSLVTPGSEWRYAGPGSGRGVRHTVCDVFVDEDGPLIADDVLLVATWSDPFAAGHPEGGHSWLGDIGDFLKQFVPWKDSAGSVGPACGE